MRQDIAIKSREIGQSIVCSRARGARLGRLILAFILALIALTSLSSILYAQVPQRDPIKVGVYTSPPFVEKRDGVYTGMAIDLWEKAALELGWTYTYREFSNYTELAAATANATVDVAVTNMTITEHRARFLDFSYPWFDGGLRIMVDSRAPTGIGSVLSGLKQAGHLQTYALLFAVVLIATLLTTLADRRFDPERPERWRDSAAESFYHVMSMATSGKTTRKSLFGWVGRTFQALWMAVGLAIMAYVTSSLASVMTLEQIEGTVRNLDDLKGKTIGVRAGSAAQHYLEGQQFQTRPYDHIEDAAEALTSGTVDAIVGDAPVLEHYAQNAPGAGLTVVGPTFHPDKYGFAFPPGSTFEKRATLQIIHFQESGELEAIRSRYFGGRH